MVNLQIFSLFFVIFLGYLAKKLKFASDAWVPILNNFAFYIAFPALVFVSLAFSDFNFLFYNNIIFWNFLFIILFGAFLYLVCSFLKMEKGEKITFLIASVFGNVAYLGVPVGKILFGDSGELIAVALSAMYLIIVLTLGIFLLESYNKKKGKITAIFRNILKLPLFWSIILGIIFSAFHFRLPEFLSLGLKMVGSTASPIALFALGIFLGFRVLKEKTLSAIFLSLLKMIIFPLFLFLFLNFCKFDIKSEEFIISVLQSAMPLAVTNFVLAEKYNLNRSLVANSIFFTTTLSLLSIPLLIKFLT